MAIVPQIYSEIISSFEKSIADIEHGEVVARFHGAFQLSV